MTKPNPDIEERAPDGITKLEYRRLRTLYKKKKSSMIENDILTLADPDAKSTDVLNNIKSRQHIEEVLGIVASKPSAEDGAQDESLGNAMDILKKDMEATQGPE